MKIGVLFNCQSDGVAAALQALLPGAEVINFTGGAVKHSPERQAEVAAALHKCDHVISSGFDLRFGPLTGRVLRRTARRYHDVPAVTFTGFHPDMIYVPVEGGGPLTGPTGDYHSRLAVTGFLAGLTPAEAAAMYNRLVFQRLGYLEVFARQCVLLTEYFAKREIDATPLLRGWLAAGSFMHSVNHPKMNVLLDLARTACMKMGVTPEDAGAAADRLPDKLSAGPMHPVFPAVAAAAGVAPEGIFRNAKRLNGSYVELSPEAFVAASFAVYETIPAAALHAADGVAAALGVLGLPVRR